MSNNPFVIMKDAAAAGDYGPILAFLFVTVGFFLPAIIGYFQEKRNHEHRSKNCSTCPNFNRGGCWDGEAVTGRMWPASGCSAAQRWELRQRRRRSGARYSCRSAGCRGCPTCGSR